MGNRTVRGLVSQATVGLALLTVCSPAWAQTFVKGTKVPADIYAPDLEAADINGDGHLDAAVGANAATTGTQHVRILAGDGAGGFAQIGDFAPPNTNLSGLAMGDMNGDGYADLASVPPNSSGGLGVALNDGSGGFGAPIVRPLANTYGLRAADLDGDGDRDLAAVRSAQSPAAILVYSNDGAGAFSLATTVVPNPTSSLFGDLAIGDVKEDGRPDMLALRGNPNGSLIPLLYNEPPAISSVRSPRPVLRRTRRLARRSPPPTRTGMGPPPPTGGRRKPRGTRGSRT